LSGGLGERNIHRHWGRARGWCAGPL